MSLDIAALTAIARFARRPVSVRYWMARGTRYAELLELIQAVQEAEFTGPGPQQFVEPEELV